MKKIIVALAGLGVLMGTVAANAPPERADQSTSSKAGFRIRFNPEVSGNGSRVCGGPRRRISQFVAVLWPAAQVEPGDGWSGGEWQFRNLSLRWADRRERSSNY